MIEKQIGSIENLEKYLFRKITWFLKTFLKALSIRNKMHEYEMKCFSKAQVLNPVFPNLRFSNNRTSWIWFFKNGSWLFQKQFFQKFFKFSLSLRSKLGSTSVVCRLWSFLLQGFSLQTPVRPFYPSFCFYFHISCIFNLGISDYA